MSPERLEEILEHLFHGILNQFLRKKGVCFKVKTEAEEQSLLETQMVQLCAV